jgi:hypothetical protein
MTIIRHALTAADRAVATSLRARFPSSIALFEAARAAHDVIAAFLRAELAI